MNKKYVLKLTAEERSQLEAMTRQRIIAVGKRQKVRALLLCDQSEAGPGRPDTDVAEEVGAGVRSVESWRKRACEEGPIESLERRPRTVKTAPKLDGEAEAELLQIACSAPPEGRSRWSLRLLADRLVELEVVDTICHETVRQTLQKTMSSRT